MRKIIILVLFMILAIPSTHAEIQTKEVEYQQGEVTLKGYLAFDDSIDGKCPGILVVHEWWGHNTYARKRVEMLAELGYTALAVDMYGDGKQADHPDSAKEFSSEVMQDIGGIGKARFLAALNLLKEHPKTDPEHIAAIGYCFGGGTVLHMARFGLDLDGVVSFHGSLSTQTHIDPGTIKARILVCNGADDSFVTQEEITAFKNEMEEAHADYQLINYEGAVHSFTNPQADEFAEKFNLPIAYNADADQKSWQDMQAFFKEIFE